MPSESAATGAKNVFRIDVFWFVRNAASPMTDFYPSFWRVLERFAFRPHWGKFLPPPDPADPRRLTRLYPGWERFEAVRRRADPTGMFATRYWREHLGLGS